MRLHLACLVVLLGVLGLPRPAVAAPRAAAVTATQVGSRDTRHENHALLLPSEALGAQAVVSRGPGLFPALPLAFLHAALPWQTAATLAAHTAPRVRPGELADYFRTWLLLAALSPHAP